MEDVNNKETDKLLRTHHIDIQSRDECQSEINYNALTTEEKNSLLSELNLSIAKGDNDMAQKLINLGVNLNSAIDPASNDIFVPLSTAIKVDNLDAFIMLLRAGVDINTKDHYGNTPLMYAIMYKSEIMTKMLLALNADTEIKNNAGKQAKDLAIENHFSEKYASIIEESKHQEKTPNNEDMMILNDYIDYLLKNSIVQSKNTISIEEIIEAYKHYIKEKSTSEKQLITVFMHKLLTGCPQAEKQLTIKEAILKRLANEITMQKENETSIKSNNI